MNGLTQVLVNLIVLVVSLSRVAFIIAIWLAVFIIMFLGYLTIPLVMLTVFMAVYTVFDLRRAIRRTRVRRGTPRRP